jgi:hypothetical protein
MSLTLGDHARELLRPPVIVARDEPVRNVPLLIDALGG